MRREAEMRRRAAAVAVAGFLMAGSGIAAVAAAPAGAAGRGMGALENWIGSGHHRVIRGPSHGAPAPGPTLSGNWASFNRCPVDNPTMLAADGVKDVAACLAVSAPSGAIKIGGLGLPIGPSGVQFGFVLEEVVGGQAANVISPDGGALSIPPVDIPDGLRALLCPSAPRALGWLCAGHPGGLDRGHDADIAASVQQAGEPSNFSIFASLLVGVPVMTEPVKVHLENALLGPRCYIGSNSEPIVLQVENFTEPTGFRIEDYEEDGQPYVPGGPNPMLLLGTLGTRTGDESFAVPGASGCGPRGELDDLIDHSAGLPSPAGENALTLNETSSELTGFNAPEEQVPNDGTALSRAWHAAIVSEPHGHH